MDWVAPPPWNTHSVIVEIGENLLTSLYPLSMLISSENHISLSKEISNPSANSIIKLLEVSVMY